MVRPNGSIFRVSVLPLPQLSYSVGTDTSSWFWREGKRLIREAVDTWKIKSVGDPDYVGPLSLGRLVESGSVAPTLLNQGHSGALRIDVYKYGMFVTLGDPSYETVFQVRFE